MIWIMRRVWMVVLIATAAVHRAAGLVEFDAFGNTRHGAQLDIVMLLIAGRERVEGVAAFERCHS